MVGKYKVFVIQIFTTIYIRYIYTILEIAIFHNQKNRNFNLCTDFQKMNISKYFVFWKKDNKVIIIKAGMSNRNLNIGHHHYHRWRWKLNIRRQR